MLKSLYISNYALIDKLEIDFPEGLTIITGETGAGKSILLGALSLLLGARADKEVIKNSDKNCVVEGLFILKEGEVERELFEENQLDYSQELTIRRVLFPTGRSRSFLNDQPVNNRFLRDLSQKIIDIHAQHQHLLVADSTFRMEALDSFASNREIKARYQRHHSTVQEKRRELEQLRAKLEQEESDYQYNQYQYDRIEELKLTVESFSQEEEEYKMLSNAEELQGALQEVENLFNPPYGSIVENLRALTTLFERHSNTLSKLAPLAERLESCRIELQEIERESSEVAEGVTADPRKLLHLEERVSQVYNLLTLHRVEDVEELLELQKKYGEKLSNREHYREEIEVKERESKEGKEQLIKSGKELTLSREKALLPFQKEIESKIRELEMPYATFQVALKEFENYRAEGKEEIQFHFSANREIPLKEISKVASGGELSRIMLCLKAVMARDANLPTLIFDEIDSGVSGSIADKMGNLIGELSQNLQLFAITHLPQIASKGENHLLVYKDEESGAAESKIKRIEGEERVKEIARMLSGSELTEAAIANAREFLNS